MHIKLHVMASVDRGGERRETKKKEQAFKRVTY